MAGLHRAFDREAKARDADREPLILTLEGTQPALVTARLRGLGFRWSKVLLHWEGLAVYNAAKTAADELGGALRRVAAPETETAAQADGETDDAGIGSRDADVSTVPTTASPDAAE